MAQKKEITKKKNILQNKYIGGLLLLLLAVAGTLTVLKLADTSTEKASAPEDDIVCSPPYIRYAAGCCLDKDENAVCDQDEGIKKKKIPPEETDRGAEEVVPSDTSGTTTSTTPSTTSGTTTPSTPSTTPGTTPSTTPSDTSTTSSSTTTSSESADTETTPTTLSTEKNCQDNIDNDNDGSADSLDYDCVGKVCDTAWSGVKKKWVWSYMPDEASLDASHTPPPVTASGMRRIGCCLGTTQCVTNAPECKTYDTLLSTSLVCGDENDWDECRTARDEGAISDGGGYRCTYYRDYLPGGRINAGWRWVRVS